MNETSIAYALLKDVEDEARKHGVGSIRRVHVDIDGLSSVVPDELVFAFQSISEGTMAEGAELAVNTIPAAVECARCKETLSSDRVMQSGQCPDCGFEIAGTAKGKPFKVALVRASIERSGALSSL